MSAKREKIKCILYTFATTTDAMAMEEVCVSEAIPGRLIPVPSFVRAGCGYGWRITKEDNDKFKDKILKAGLKFENTAEIEAWK